MVENDVEDHIDASGMGSLNQFCQFLFCGGRCAIRGEAGIDGEKVLDAITMIIVLLPAGWLGVFEDWCDPDGADAHVEQVVQLGFDALEGASLPVAIALVPWRRGATSGIIEPVGHQEVDPGIPANRRAREG